MKKLPFVIVLVAAPALADPISLRVAGAGVSATALAPKIAAELGADVAPATDACNAPCLDVVVEAASATVRFTPASGAPRERTIAIGTDRDAWPVLITLLAGNLARDEAAQILAGLPVPVPVPGPEPVGSPADVPDVPAIPAPAAPAPTVKEIAPPKFAASADDDEHESTFVFGLVPGLSTDFADLHVRHDLALHMAIGIGGGLDGFAIAGAADIENGSVDGWQLSGAVNVARDVDGFQVAGGVNVAQSLDGFQLAGGVNVAGDTDGFQVAGGVNIARDVDGLQVAPINVARRVGGTQLGVINVGGEGDGVSIGLIDIVPGGRTDVEASVDDHAVGTLLLRHGGHHWHNVYGVGAQRAQDVSATAREDLWMAGLGLGPSWEIGATTWDLEAICWHVSPGAKYETNLSLLNQLRLSVGMKLGGVQLVGGAALNVFVGDNARAPFLARTIDPTTPMDDGVGVRTWGTLFAGVRI
ncbi:MAG TPA: hypothetical protein VL463_26140 [Kofleriaceae bacterium]|nr:hypothetical protein [Kofleriaceae bacterium]